jgi:LmbE family N-acetylglucosaminyl deacetylase
MVFAPHPDDETLGCGGTIAKKISQGFEVFIVLVTDGRHSYSKVLGIQSNPSPEELVQIRKEEFKRAASILEVPEKNLLSLDFEDGTLEEHEKEAEARIVGILKEYSPSEVYFSFRRDCHPDHRSLSRIVVRGIRESGLACGSYQYSIIHKYARFGPIMERVVSLFKRNTVRTDISEFLDLKEKAIKTYRSELAIISGKQNGALQRNIKCFLKKEEVFYVFR